MAETILSVYAQDLTGEKLEVYLDSTDFSLDSVDHISNLVVESLQNNICQSEDSIADSLRLTSAILKASPENGLGAERRSQVLKGAINWLLHVGPDQIDSDTTFSGNSNPNVGATNELAESLVNALIDVGQTFSNTALVASIHLMMEAIRRQSSPHAQMFSLLARLLVIASSHEELCMAGSTGVEASDTMVSGIEFTAMVLDRICTAPMWHRHSILPLAIMFGDLEMTQKQLEAAVVKLLKRLHDIDTTHLPALAYHLLVLSSKGHRKLILRGVIEFFDQLDANMCARELSGTSDTDMEGVERHRTAAQLEFPELTAIESSLILHFSFAVKQDQELGMELLKHMKSGKTAYLSPFSLACLLAMARIHRFEDSVMSFLKANILLAIKDTERMDRELWIEGYSGMMPVNVPAMFGVLIKRLPFGFEQIPQSLIQLGVYLIDTVAPSSPFKSLHEKPPPTNYSAMAPNARTCELAIVILMETFRVQEAVRGEVLDQIMSRIVAKSSSTLYFLKLLEMLISECPEVSMDYLPKIKESLDYLSLLSLPTAVRLMLAIRDVAQINRSFRDGLMLILRKALFSKTLESRQVALSGFLMLLEPPSPSKGVTGSSRRARQHSHHHHGVDQVYNTYSTEILGMLRRCLNQQGEIRMALYAGLLRLTNLSPGLSPTILEILQAHFVQFYDSTGTCPCPIRLEECVSNSRTGGVPGMMEPLHLLMSAVVRSLILSMRIKTVARDGASGASLDDLLVAKSVKDFDRLVLGFERAGLEDFELDKTSDFNMNTNIGLRNNMYATLVIGCYEAAIEYTVLKPVFSETGVGAATADSLSHGAAETILNLYAKMAKLFDIVKSSGPRVKKLGAFGESSVLSLECVTKLMETLYPVTNNQLLTADPESVTLRQSDEFVYYLCIVVQLSLSKFQSSTDHVPTEKEFEFCQRLGKVLVREFLVNDTPGSPRALLSTNNNGNQGAKASKEKSLMLVGIEALNACLGILNQHYEVIGVPKDLWAKPNVLGIRFEMNQVQEQIQGQHQSTVASFLATVLPQVNNDGSSFEERQRVVTVVTRLVMIKDLDRLADLFIDYLQGLIVECVNETVPMVKEATGLLNTIMILTRYLNRPVSSLLLPRADSGSSTTTTTTTNTQADSLSSSSRCSLEKLLRWLARFCSQQPIQDLYLLKALVPFFLSLEQECSAFGFTADNGPITISELRQGGGGNATLVQPPTTTGSLKSNQVVSATTATQLCPGSQYRVRMAGDLLLLLDLHHGVSRLNDDESTRLRSEQSHDQDPEDRLNCQQLLNELGGTTDPVFGMVTMKTCITLINTVLQQVDKSLEALEWALTNVKTCGLQSGLEFQYGSSSNSKVSPTLQMGSRLQPADGVAAAASMGDGHRSDEQADKASNSGNINTILQQTSATSAGSTSSFSSSTTTTTTATKKPFQDFQLDICHRLETNLWILDRLAQAQVPAAVTELLIRVLQKTYKVLTMVTKHFLNTVTSTGSGAGSTTTSSGSGKSNGLPKAFLRMTRVAGSELSKHLYLFLTYFQMLDEQEREHEEGEQQAKKRQKMNKKGKKKASATKGGKNRTNADGDGEDGMELDGQQQQQQEQSEEEDSDQDTSLTPMVMINTRQSAKIIRESKLIPLLIYNVEQYEQNVIQLGKKSKISLTQYLRRSTARDFRIQVQKLQDLNLEDGYHHQQQQETQRTTTMLNRQQDDDNGGEGASGQQREDGFGRGGGRESDLRSKVIKQERRVMTNDSAMEHDPRQEQQRQRKRTRDDRESERQKEPADEDQVEDEVLFEQGDDDDDDDDEPLISNRVRNL